MFHLPHCPSLSHRVVVQDVPAYNWDKLRYGGMLNSKQIILALVTFPGGNETKCYSQLLHSRDIGFLIRVDFPSMYGRTFSRSSYLDIISYLRPLLFSFGTIQKIRTHEFSDFDPSHQYVF